MKKVILAFLLVSAFSYGIAQEDDIDCTLNPDHPSCQTSIAPGAPTMDTTVLEDFPSDAPTTDAVEPATDATDATDDDLDSDSSF